MAKTQEHLSGSGYTTARGEIMNQVKKRRKKQRELSESEIRQAKERKKQNIQSIQTGTMGKSAQAVREKRNAAIEEEIRKKMKKKK